MILNIKFPDDLRSESLLKQQCIPCFCRVSNIFEIDFENVVTNKTTGTVEDWSNKELNDRAAAGGGGAYTYYCHGTITLKKLDQSQFEILDLNFFGRGWHSIVHNGAYSTKTLR